MMHGVAFETEMAGSTPTTRHEHMSQHHYLSRATMTENNAVTGIYPTHSEAEAAVKALQRAGFDMQEIVHRGEGLSHRRARHRILQHR